jgi:hypothetical protein
MRRTHILAVLALAAAVPAAAAAAGSFFSTSFAPPDGPCFVSGQTGYRLSSATRADYTVRVAPADADLVVELVNDPTAADFILIDDNSDIRSCERASAVRTVRLGSAGADADLTIAVTSEPGMGHLRVYAQAAGVSAQDAAALFAVAWKAPRKRQAALHR